MKKLLLLTVVLFAAFGLSGCNYNSLTAGQQGIKGKWANVESQLQRTRSGKYHNRWDLALGRMPGLDLKLGRR